ncbi:MAG: 23S rRNA (uracil(1939)-C(5))-methyltransferase RlmD [Gammaproteobacteria bacterium]|nr:23S rRNA (uracil(1939)-C(5))-methyltransferase RlmD [Gammaproteobacteria bacterium]
MGRKRRQSGPRIPKDPVEVIIESLSPDGRGVTHIDGKVTFIDGALPNERVRFIYLRRHKKQDEGRVVEVLEASPDRVETPCQHADICGGCTLQHLRSDKQIEFKQNILKDHLWHLAKTEPKEWLPPILGPTVAYRRKARLGVKYVIKKQKLLVGFREKRSAFLAEITECKVLHESVGLRIEALKELITGLDAFDRMPQIEVAVSDNATLLVFRFLDEATESDIAALQVFAQEQKFWVAIQPKGPDSIFSVWPEDQSLVYTPVDNIDTAENIFIHFKANDFTQVNATINQQMIKQVIELLDLKNDDDLLELFCGLGNFTLPMAKHCQSVKAIEADEGMVKRARENAITNKINNVDYAVADLYSGLEDFKFLKATYSKLFLDPPRSGAFDVVSKLPKLSKNRIVYVSCHPATLARDAAVLIEQGYVLEKAGVMDMFPHTAHVESVALFSKP